ncbi:hypothetical protein [Marinicella marina]|uniref:hypothetical protein n=1 Tax=Marinicella marina TaxID=2996016 RepID=UPI0022610142|nr:hypothetical protein [Marinicella marina]
MSLANHISLVGLAHTIKSGRMGSAHQNNKGFFIFDPEIKRQLIQLSTDFVLTNKSCISILAAYEFLSHTFGSAK